MTGFLSFAFLNFRNAVLLLWLSLSMEVGIMLNLPLRWLPILLVLYVFQLKCRRCKEESIIMAVYAGASMSSTDYKTGSFYSLTRIRWPGLKLSHEGRTQNCTEAPVQDSNKEAEKCVLCIKALICSWGFELCKPFWMRWFFSNANHFQEEKTEDLVWWSFTTLRGQWKLHPETTAPATLQFNWSKLEEIPTINPF